MQEKYRTVLLFGAPGSGKGTQGKILGAIPGFFHLACGDIFRMLKPESELGQLFLSYSSQGRLVPDNFTVQLWSRHIESLVHAEQFLPLEEILVLDGIPRNANQVALMSEYIDVIQLVYLETQDEEQMIRRLHRRALRENRLDDASEEVIRQRFRKYASETAPVLDFYSDELTCKVDAGQSPLGVLQDIIASIQLSEPVVV